MNIEKHIQPETTVKVQVASGMKKEMIANTMSIRRNQNDVRRSVVARIGEMPEPMSEMFFKIILKPARKNGSVAMFRKARKRLITADIL